jgi:hypothetical protein
MRDMDVAKVDLDVHMLQWQVSVQNVSSTSGTLAVFVSFVALSLLTFISFFIHHVSKNKYGK